MVFFFSSRRRHTRFDCDWSSDVCSSDLWQVFSGAYWGKTRLTSGGVYPRRPDRRHKAGGSSQVALPTLDSAGERMKAGRSGERRVGEEGRSRWAPDHLKKKKKDKVERQ